MKGLKGWREEERKRAGGEELGGCLAPRQHIPQLPHTDVRSGLVFGSRFGPRLAVIGGVWGRVRPNEVSGSLVRGEQQPWGRRLELESGGE